MSNASFHNFDSESNELRCNFSTNKLKFKAIRTLEPPGKDHAPRILREVYSTRSRLSQFSCVLFGNPLGAMFSKFEIFPATV